MSKKRRLPSRSYRVLDGFGVRACPRPGSSPISISASLQPHPRFSTPSTSDLAISPRQFLGKTGTITASTLRFLALPLALWVVLLLWLPVWKASQSVTLPNAQSQVGKACPVRLKMPPRPHLHTNLATIQVSGHNPNHPSAKASNHFSNLLRCTNWRGDTI